MSYDYLMGCIMSISMCMQNFVTIFHSVQEIAPLSLFQNLELGKASTEKNVISQSLGLDLVNINVYTKVYQNIPLSSRDRAIFTFFRIWRSAKPQPMINVILQFLELDLAIPWARSCQYRLDMTLAVDRAVKLQHKQKILSISMCLQTFIKIFQTV